MRGASERAARLLSALLSARGAVSGDMLAREVGGQVSPAVSALRTFLRGAGAPEGVITERGLGYRVTPELRAWVSQRVSA